MFGFDSGARGKMFIISNCAPVETSGTDSDFLKTGTEERMTNYREDTQRDTFWPTCVDPDRK